MAAPELGPWEPLSVTATVETFRAASFRWWISGGRALELHLGRSWRDHEDTDVGLARGDVVELPMVLDGWDLHVAAGGRLQRWAGQELRAELDQNNLWCRRHPEGAWSLDVAIAEGDRNNWCYRRDARVRVPWGDAILHTSEGVPYLPPELQLLFKSKDRRGKDDVDAGQVVPILAPFRRDRLARLLPADHPWQGMLSAAR
jgi:hypothetical protein